MAYRCSISQDVIPTNERTLRSCLGPGKSSFLVEMQRTRTILCAPMSRLCRSETLFVDLPYFSSPSQAASRCVPCRQQSFFQNINNFFLDTFSQQIYFLIIKINNFWGDLSGISATTATLLADSDVVFEIK